MRKGIAIVSLIGSLFTGLTACKTPESKLMGNWKLVDNWSELEGDYAPRKDDTNYSTYHNYQKEALEDVVFFYGRKTTGTIDSKGDTANVYPYYIEEETKIVMPHQTVFYELKGKDTLLIKIGAESQLFIKK
ncbi:MAG TPA: hypothetical protein VK027_09380 [Chitinophagaceae bacterium]|nr:hypothetical protein [Chitinophagaceae bacterium]